MIILLFVQHQNTLILMKFTEITLSLTAVRKCNKPGNEPSTWVISVAFVIKAENRGGENRGGWKCDFNRHKIARSFALNFSKNW